jgi:hypothetical protein
MRYDVIQNTYTVDLCLDGRMKAKRSLTLLFNPLALQVVGEEFRLKEARPFWNATQNSNFHSQPC